MPALANEAEKRFWRIFSLIPGARTVPLSPGDRDASENSPASPLYSSAGLGPAGDQPGWATGTALDLRGANEDRGPRRRNLAEIRHAFETPFVAAEQRLVGLELLVRPDVQRDGVDADAGNVALRDQELAGILGEAREVERVRLIGTQVGLGVAGLHVPARLHEHAATPGQATMVLLPRLDVIDGHGTVRVPLGALADVDDRSRDDQAAHGNLFRVWVLAMKWQGASMCVPLWSMSSHLLT